MITDLNEMPVRRAEILSRECQAHYTDHTYFTGCLYEVVRFMRELWINMTMQLQTNRCQENLMIFIIIQRGIDFTHCIKTTLQWMKKVRGEVG